MVKEMLGLTARIARLPVDPRGYPIPKFVEWIDGKPDFRVMSGDHLYKCVKQNLCWICGEPLGRHKAFVIGPMCAINRISAEPPSHLDCAHFAVANCPFLNEPRAKRRKKVEGGVVAGEGLMRNPGVSMVWVTDNYKPFRPPNGGVLFEVGTPHHVQFYAESRIATDAEVEQSFITGLPLLIATGREEGVAALKELRKMTVAAYTLIELPPNNALDLIDKELQDAETSVR